MTTARRPTGPDRAAAPSARRGPAMSIVYYIPTDDGELLVSTMAERGKARENRVVLRCRPYATFASPPRHLHHNDQAEQLTHWASTLVPWDAPDPV